MFKGNQKLHVLSRMQSLSTAKKRIIIIFKSFIESQFKYCPLTCMFCSAKINNNQTNRLHERSLTFKRLGGQLEPPPSPVVFPEMHFLERA